MFLCPPVAVMGIVPLCVLCPLLENYLHPTCWGLRSAGYRGLKPVVGPPESITVWTNASPLSPAALPNVNPASDSVVGGERPKSLISPLAPQATRRDGCPQIPHPFLSEIPQRARTSKPLPSWFAAVGPASHGEGRGAVASRS
ncbi:unnamed protein product [Caretta caretta]